MFHLVDNNIIPEPLTFQLFFDLNEGSNYIQADNGGNV